jgi:hypothetical protein
VVIYETQKPLHHEALLGKKNLYYDRYGKEESVTIISKLL